MVRALRPHGRSLRRRPAAQRECGHCGPCHWYLSLRGSVGRRRHTPRRYGMSRPSDMRWRRVSSEVTDQPMLMRLLQLALPLPEIQTQSSRRSTLPLCTSGLDESFASRALSSTFLKRTGCDTGASIAPVKAISRSAADQIVT